MIYEVVYCSDCKKPIKSVPSWLASVNVRFTCESCRQKHPRGFVGLDTTLTSKSAVDPDLDGDPLIGVAPGEMVEDDEVLDEAADDVLIDGVVED